MEWAIKKLGDVCQVIAGQSPDGKFYNDNGNGLPFYQGKKEFGDKYIGEPKKWTSYTTKEAINGDILISVRAPVGPINFATQRICIGRGLAAIRPTEQLDRNFLFYGLLNMQKDISGNEGAVFASINKSQIERIEFSFPPLSEQKRIVAILDEAFAGIDAAIENTKRNLVNARELFESYLNNVFIQKGEGWVEKKLSDICQNLDSKRIPITKSQRESGIIPYYGASGIVDYVAGYIFNESLLLVSEDGANLLARTYPIAFSISGKTWVNNHAHVLRFDNLSSQKFVEFYLNSISLKPYVSGMAQPKLNQKSLNEIPIPYPDINMQAKIVEDLERLSFETQLLKSTYQQKLEALNELKQSILQKAFNGELTREEVAA
ncbi:restriction endonuclease subunit S [Sneathiella chungangensis]|uniref:Restriction endonuclease subunit S n=1 Tax=Sneathiella chungangensis TaxID=1418234 RepID=A0A845MJI2_9PROT|nr:restriction endonuclease subunit S [Sneathiella chungangensis]MZR23891.1 restriction endonuclease subunit S [Sneathiella chungangensis]